MELRYIRPALAGLADILDYIAARSPNGAANVQARIKAITELLLHHPRIGSPTDDPTIRRLTTPTCWDGVEIAADPFRLSVTSAENQSIQQEKIQFNPFLIALS